MHAWQLLPARAVAAAACLVPAVPAVLPAHHPPREVLHRHVLQPLLGQRVLQRCGTSRAVPYHRWSTRLPQTTTAAAAPNTPCPCRKLRCGQTDLRHKRAASSSNTHQRMVLVGRQHNVDRAAEHLQRDPGKTGCVAHPALPVTASRQAAAGGQGLGTAQSDAWLPWIAAQACCCLNQDC